MKNYLFSLAKDQISDFKIHWNRIADLVGGAALSQFLRHYWLSERALVRERDLYRALRDEVSGPPSARKLINRLQISAELYSALLNPDHQFWATAPPAATDSLSALLLFRATQFRPLAMAAMEWWKLEDVASLLRTIAVISFRYSIISSLGTGNLERIYSDAALRVRERRATTPHDVFQLLRDAYVDDEKFESDFARYQFTKNSLARYALERIEAHMAKDPEHEVRRLSLEHILPRTPSEEWPPELRDTQNNLDIVERIGNLTLLELGKNRGISNSGFDLKKERAFSQSKLALNMDLLSTVAWDRTAIEKRSSALAANAKAVWRVDY